MSDLAPYDLEASDVDWPDWLLGPLPSDFVEGYEKAPADAVPGRLTRTQEMVELAKVDPDTWAVLKPYVRRT